jgi:dienelactone hydrolase
MPVSIRTGQVLLDGDLMIPQDALGIVLFAHGSGSSRASPRNRYVAKELQKGHIATLLFDLLTPDEEQLDERTAHLRFDIEFLAGRLLGVTDWLERHERARDLSLGYFGASTGAAAALVAAARRSKLVSAVVSRGGRPDLAGAALRDVLAPTLLIVGSHDEEVIQLNEQALAQLTCEKKLEIVPGASHLFEEPGTLEEVARLARDWFANWLARDYSAARH